MKTSIQTKRLGAALLLMLTSMLPSLAVDYGITVGGVKVTSDNKNNIKGSSITSGTVTYNPSAKMLILHEVTIVHTSGYGIHSDVEDLEIYFTGSESYIKATFPLDICASATVHGVSRAYTTLQLEASISPVYVDRNVNLEISDIKLETYGGTSSGAIRGYGTNSTLKVRNADLFVDAGENPCVKGITDCILDGVEVSTPNGVCYRKNLKGFGTKTALATGKLKIIKPSEYYNVDVCGHRLNDVNKNNFSYDNVEGSVSYVKVTKEISSGVFTMEQFLQLKDVTGNCENPNDYCICATDEIPLTIYCSGTNTLTSKHTTSLFTRSAKTEIWGGGTLNLNGEVIVALSDKTCDFLVGNGSTLNAKSIRGCGKGTFTISDSEVNFSGNTDNDATAISGFDELSMSNVDFVMPDYGKYDQYVLDENGNKWNGAVKIGEKNYGITVGGVAVTTKNMDNITGSNIDGKVSFESNGATNTLYLDDVTINNSQGYGIGNRSGKPLNVRVKGTCSVSGTHAIYSEDDLTIHGGFEMSSLTVKGSITGILVTDNRELSLGFLNLKASGATSSGCIRGGGKSKLKLFYSNIDIDAGSYPCVKGFDKCTQDLTEVSYPKETWFSSTLKGFGNANGLTTGNLVLETISQDYGISVAGHSLNNLNKDNFYYENVSGMLQYDPDLNILALNEFTADCAGNSRGIYLKPQRDIILGFVGDNRITGVWNQGIYADMGDKDLYILSIGESSLEVDGGVDIYGNLLISGDEDGRPTLKATYLNNSNGGKATISDSRVYLTGDGINSTIRGFGSIDEGTNFIFARPLNATYSDGQLWADGQIVTDRVVISYVEHDTAIDEAVQENNVTVDSTYDLLGRRSDSRRSGIILQHMSDGTVRKQLVK